MPKILVILGCRKNGVQRIRLSDVAVFENRQSVTEDKFITKSSLFILLLIFVRRLELKLINKQKFEIIFVTRHIAKPPVCVQQS